MNSFRQIKDEIYLRCVCGGILNGAGMVKHIDCFIKKDFIKNTSVLKIIRPCNSSEQSKYVCDKCIRCGCPMSKDKCILITLYPPTHDFADMHCNYTCNSKEESDSAHKICKLANNFHQKKPENENRKVNHIDNTINDVNSDSENRIEEKYRIKQTLISDFFSSLPRNFFSSASENMAVNQVVHNNTTQNGVNYVSENKMEDKYRQKQTVISELFQPNGNVSSNFPTMQAHPVTHFNTRNDEISVSESEMEKKYRKKQTIISEFFLSLSAKNSSSGSEKKSEHQNLEVYDEGFSGLHCKSFHIAILPNYTGLNASSTFHSNSLLLQILDQLSPETSVSTQTDSSNTKEIGVQVRILGIYPEEVEKLLASRKSGYDLTEFDPITEAAYLKHLATLIPCKHCSRRFSPDRIVKHVTCCIKRPRTREYTPTKIQEILR